MSDLWVVGIALLAFVLPMVLAWWLLGRTDRRRPRDDAAPRRGKMPP